MNKTDIKNFAIWARNKLISEIKYTAGLYGVTENGIAEELPASESNLKFYDIGTKEPAKVRGIAIIQRNALVNAINKKAEEVPYKKAFEYVIEEVAYTWFNRLIAIRFMEVNDYLPVRVLSSESAGKKEPDMVTTPFETDIDFSDKDREMMQNLKDDELFRFLFIKQCNKLNEYLPELFEQTDNYTELLLPISFRDEDGIIYHLVNDISEDDFREEIQIIGWLYQYYNTEPKDKVFSRKSTEKIQKEEIPAATQLFTPKWIVKYMVENSLGRLWVDGHSDFDKSQWKYYLDEAEQEESVKAQLDAIREENKNISPEEIKFIDPCMGSGHILAYAYDVFMQIYLSQGYTERDAASKIIEKNLFGLELDKRAYQLAYFALMIKGRKSDRRFFTRRIKPNLAYFSDINGFKTENIDEKLKDFAEQFHNADTYGSLIEVSGFDIDEITELVEKFEEDMFTEGYKETLLKMLDCYKILSQKYDICCTNPPYMGGSGMNTTLSNYVKKNYSDSKSDLFACFIERCAKYIKINGYYAMITQHAFMFLSSYENLRKKLLLQTTLNMAHLGARAFDEIGGEVVQTTSFIKFNSHIENYKGTYSRLVDVNGEKEKEQLYLIKEKIYTAKQENFSKIPGSPVAYWVSENFINMFDAPHLKEISRARRGLETGNNEKFLRLWYEVNFLKIDFHCNSIESFSKKWLPHNKGGNFRVWYGNCDFIVNFENDGKEIRKTGTLNGYDVYLKEGITWTALTSGKNSFRYTSYGFTFDSNKGPLIVDNGNNIINYLLGFFNSKITYSIVKIINPSLSLQNGDVDKLPIIIDEQQKPIIDNIVQENIALSKTDWDSFETSWDFKKHPFINGEKTIEKSFEKWAAECEQRFNTLKANEEELNRIFIDIYGLQDELTPEVEDKDVTVRKADLTRDIKSFVSYAVGCMFGRYSLDRDGLVFAGGDFDEVYWKHKGAAALDENGEPIYGGYAGISLAPYQYLRFKDNSNFEEATLLTYPPDADNCIPITDTEYFENDIVNRFAEFVRVVYGADTLEENLDFIAKALGNKGNTSRQIIRNYFLNDFFKDHCKIYQKRPIYWLFDSGKQNGFKALVYMHRWNTYTTGNVNADYILKLQGKYEEEIERIQDTIDKSDDSREISKAEKIKDKLIKQQKEAKEYQAKIAHLAPFKIDIDLDDGVKVNYEKVQTAKGKKFDILAKI